MFYVLPVILYLWKLDETNFINNITVPHNFALLTTRVKENEKKRTQNIFCNFVFNMVFFQLKIVLSPKKKCIKTIYFSTVQAKSISIPANYTAFLNHANLPSMIEKITHWSDKSEKMIQSNFLIVFIFVTCMSMEPKRR